MEDKKMDTYLVEYVLDRTLTAYTITVSADDYSEAYLSVLLAIPRGAIITEVFKI